MSHPRDPSKRIETRPAPQHIRVSIGGEPVADTTRAVALLESGLPTRWYIPREDVSAELAENHGHHTTCPYKGDATHWDVAGEDAIAWSYEVPLDEAAAVKSMISFYNERVDIEVDGEPEERPRTNWTR